MISARAEYWFVDVPPEIQVDGGIIPKRTNRYDIRGEDAAFIVEGTLERLSAMLCGRERAFVFPCGANDCFDHAVQAFTNNGYDAIMTNEIQARRLRLSAEYLYNDIRPNFLADAFTLPTHSVVVASGSEYGTSLVDKFGSTAKISNYHISPMAGYFYSGAPVSYAPIWSMIGGGACMFNRLRRVAIVNDSFPRSGESLVDHFGRVGVNGVVTSYQTERTNSNDPVPSVPATQVLYNCATHDSGGVHITRNTCGQCLFEVGIPGSNVQRSAERGVVQNAAVDVSTMRMWAEFIVDFNYLNFAGRTLMDRYYVLSPIPASVGSDRISASAADVVAAAKDAIGSTGDSYITNFSPIYSTDNSWAIQAVSIVNIGYTAGLTDHTLIS